MDRNKKIMSLLGIMLGSVATCTQAATSSDDVNLRLFIPPLKPVIEYKIAALWLKPGASNLNYVILNKELPAQSPTWTEQELYPSFDGGFLVGLRYVFPNAGSKDVNLEWTHLNSNTSDSTVADGASYFLGPDYEIGPAGIPIRDAAATANFKYNVVNLDVGQYIQFGQQLTMRLFAGLSGGDLKEEVSTTFSGTRIGGDFPGPFSMNQDVTSKFVGIGPRFGVTANYDYCCTGFGFIGEAAISALIGTMESKTHFTGSGAELTEEFDQAVNRQFIRDQRVYQVVPAFDAKLGINYKHPFYNTSLLTVTAGYQAAVYVNAISQYLPASLVDGSPLESGGIFVATMNHTLSNYSVQGPFFELSFDV